MADNRAPPPATRRRCDGGDQERSTRHQTWRCFTHTTRAVPSVKDGEVLGAKGPLMHLTEHTYPCCLPALGGLGVMPPHEGQAPV